MPKRKTAKMLAGEKRMRARISAAKKRGGLNKTEKMQTKKIVESAIKKEHVLKYFDSNSSDDPVAPQATTVGNKKEVSVIAFSSTTEFNNSGAAVKFGPQDYVPLNLAKPFKENNVDEALNAQALNGQYCLPKVAKASFSIERVPYVVPEGTVAVNNPPPSAARSLPIYYRIIKVGIKAQQGNQIIVNPNLDIMTDSNGQPTGPDQDGFDRLDMRYCPINSKKYTKISDMTGVLNQNDIITTLVHPRTAGSNTAQFNQKNGKSLTHFTIPFQLSQRKNGKLFYETPQQAGTGPSTFTSGGQRQLVLMFFTYENGHGLLGGTGQPQSPTSDDIQIKFKSTSAFVDAQ